MELMPVTVNVPLEPKEMQALLWAVSRVPPEALVVAHAQSLFGEGGGGYGALSTGANKIEAALEKADARHRQPTH
jgi:hypothetical protein